MIVVSMLGFAVLAVLAAVRLRGPGRVLITVGFALLAVGPLVLSVFLLVTPHNVAYVVGQNATWIPGWICVAVGVIRTWRASQSVPATPQWR